MPSGRCSPLLCAAVQAPDCMYGWVARYKVTTLRDIVQAISDRAPVLTKLKIAPLSWEHLADAVHCGLEIEHAEAYRAGFGRAWRRFANEFLDVESQEEYNSIKHGLRVSPGGFSMSFGQQRTAEEACPPELMRSLGGSRFGSSLIRMIPVKDKKYHYTLLRRGGEARGSDPRRLW
jgi:hypothetical protein